MNKEKEVVQRKEHCEHHQECMKVVQLVVDGQASVEQLQQFNSNVERCIPCEEGYKLEKSIKESLNSRIDKKCCPKALLEKIINIIKAN